MNISGSHGLLNIHPQSLTAWFSPPKTRVPSLQAEAPTALGGRAELLCVPVAAGERGRAHGRQQVALQEVEKWSYRHLETLPAARKQHSHAAQGTQAGAPRTSQAESDRTETEVSQARGTATGWKESAALPWV